MSLTKATYSMIDGAVINVLDYGATGDGTTAGQTAFIQAAIDAAYAANGGIVFIPKGTYLMGTSTLIIKPKIILQGEGYDSTELLWSGSHTGDGVRFEGNIDHNPSSIRAYTDVRDLFLKCTNGSNVAGGAYVDLAGTFLALTRIKTEGFGYAVIFDQSELADVDQCILQSANTALVWLVNGPDHTPGADYFYTNRISFTRNQFDQGVTIKPIVQDDGGYLHSFHDNNYNGGTFQFRAAGVSGLTIATSEWEGNSANPCIILTSTTVAGPAVGTCTGTSIMGNFIVPGSASGQSCIGVTNASGLFVSGNFLQTTGTVVKIANAQNASGFVAGSNSLNGAGPLIDGSSLAFDLTLATGVNNNVALPASGQIVGTPQFISTAGAAGAFSITGFEELYNGAQIILYNALASVCTIEHDDAGSLADNRILTKTGADITLAFGQTASFVYRFNSSRWVQIY
jgi:hypothetical protein